MIPYIGPEFVKALKSLGADKLAKDSPRNASHKPPARKKKDYRGPPRRMAARIRSLIVLLVTNKLILLLVYVYL